MFISYLKIAVRNLFRHRGFSLINIAGLSIGVAVSLLLLLWLQYHTLFDRQHEKIDRIARLLVGVEREGTERLASSTPYAILPSLVNEYPQIEDGTRLRRISDVLIDTEDKSFPESFVTLTEPGFFRIFDLPVLEGNPEEALEDVRSIILSRKSSERLFGDRAAMGQTVHIEFEDMNCGFISGEFTVRAILENPPGNSSFDSSYILPLAILGEHHLNNWTYESEAFVLLHPEATFEAVEDRIRGALARFSWRDIDKDITLHLQPHSQTHLHDENGNPRKILMLMYIFGAAGLVILGIACINYLNLSMARAITRIKEVGIRKIMGAGRIQLMGQFIMEASIIVMIAILIAILLAGLLLPGFNRVMNSRIILDTGNPLVLASLPMLAIVISLLSGLIPAMYLANFDAITTRFRLPAGSPRQLLRKALVVVQFFVTVTLLTCAFIILMQYRYIRGRDPGFKPDAILSIAYNQRFGEKYETLRQTLLANPIIKGVTMVSSPPYSVNHGNPIFWDGKETDADQYVRYMMTDPGFLDAMGLRLVAGRNFTDNTLAEREEWSIDVDYEFILNESAARLIGLENPIGESVRLHHFNGTIVGVVQDFDNSIPYGSAQPMILWRFNYFKQSILIGCNPAQRQQAIRFLRDRFEYLFPGTSFEYQFLSDRIDLRYSNSRYIMNVVGWFTLIAILLSFTGLYGLNVFITEQRTREIGIRKVIGATSGEISGLLLKDFLILIAIGAVPAIPAAWYFSRKFIEMFYYRISIEWFHFAIPLAVVLVFAVLTMLYRTLQVSRIKPSEMMRAE